MLSLLSDLKQYANLVFQLGNWLILGAALAFLGALFRNWVGYAGVAVGGAVIMFFAITGNWLGDNSARVKQLEQQLRWEQAKRSEIEATNAALNKTLEEEIEVNEENAKTLTTLEKRIDEMDD